ncbi:hypothetical protein ACFYM0_06150 [Streptomyces sp. NPDC006487]|uniref:hypothetical protein n=1 Tax=Streptomyces sp. NPDC006487 TaxID=3364748 RepID=UPI0036B27E48
MNLSPEAVLKSLAPWMLAGTAVTLALVFAVLFALFAVPYFLLRFGRHRENASGASDPSGGPGAGGLGGFTWTSAQDDDRRAG